MHISELFASLESAANRTSARTAVAHPQPSRPGGSESTSRGVGSIHVVAEIESEPTPSTPVPASSANPLLTSTAFFDACPDIDEGPLSRFRSKRIWVSSAMIATTQRCWRMFAGDIRRNLPKAGVPVRTVEMLGDPVVIVLADWGDIRLIQDERGPRVLIRICRPELMGVALAFRDPDSPVTLDAVMWNIVDANSRAHGVMTPSRDSKKPSPWKRRVYTAIQYLSLPAGKAWH